MMRSCRALSSLALASVLAAAALYVPSSFASADTADPAAYSAQAELQPVSTGATFFVDTAGNVTLALMPDDGSCCLPTCLCDPPSIHSVTDSQAPGGASDASYAGPSSTARIASLNPGGRQRA